MTRRVRLQVFDPVCTVDGEEFSNACFAGDRDIECESACPCPEPGAPEVCIKVRASAFRPPAAAGALEPLQTARLLGKQTAMPPRQQTGATMHEAVGQVAAQHRRRRLEKRPDVSGPYGLSWHCAVQVFQPVCGEDGQTYSNVCVAGVADVAVECEGICPCAGKEAPVFEKEVRDTSEDGCCGKHLVCCGRYCMVDSMASRLTCGEATCCANEDNKATLTTYTYPNPPPKSKW